ncbi:MAG: alpha/beta hydrolase [Micrococcales bacterium]|nr:alpha/beta hydrolase [Micrococcales bacterium]
MEFGELSGQASGSGPWLVLLHGNGEDHHLFDPMVPVLSPGYRVVALDTRAHGQSPRGVGPLTIDHLVEDLAGALDALGADRVALVGFSDGGNIALAFAAAYPGRIKSLITYGANLFPAGLRAGVWVQLRLGLVALRVAGLVSRRARARAQTWALMTVQPHIDPSALAVVTAPALIVAGQRDAIRLSHTELIGASLPNSTVTIVDGAGHMLPKKDPDRFVRLILDFLNHELGTDPDPHPEPVPEP